MNWLCSRWSSMRWDSSVTDSGMVPFNWLKEIQTFFNEVIWEKKSFGITPENWLPVNKRDFNAPIL